MNAKFVCYPIFNDPGTPGRTLLNWAVVARVGDGSTPPPHREDWSRLGDRAELMAHVDGVFTLDLVDPAAIINATVDFYEYPMCDRDPVDRWRSEEHTSELQSLMRLSYAVFCLTHKHKRQHA